MPTRNLSSLEQVAEDLGDTVKILKVDTDENPVLSSQLQVLYQNLGGIFCSCLVLGWFHCLPISPPFSSLHSRHAVDSAETQTETGAAVLCADPGPAHDGVCGDRCLKAGAADRGAAACGHDQRDHSQGACLIFP